MTYTDTLEDHPNYIDSRDIIERLEELRGSRDDDPLGFEDIDELTKLEEFEQEQGAADWQHGEQFIRDSHFETYAIELASDISSDIDPVVADSWPFCHIDWKAAAASLQQDYSSIEYDGITYWYR